MDLVWCFPHSLPDAARIPTLGVSLWLAGREEVRGRRHPQTSLVLRVCGLRRRGAKYESWSAAYVHETPRLLLVLLQQQGRRRETEVTSQTNFFNRSGGEDL